MEVKSSKEIWYDMVYGYKENKLYISFDDIVNIIYSTNKSDKQSIIELRKELSQSNPKEVEFTNVKCDVVGCNERAYAKTGVGIRLCEKHFEESQSNPEREIEGSDKLSNPDNAIKPSNEKDIILDNSGCDTLIHKYCLESIHGLCRGRKIGERVTEKDDEVSCPDCKRIYEDSLHTKSKDSSLCLKFKSKVK